MGRAGFGEEFENDEGLPLPINQAAALSPCWARVLAHVFGCFLPMQGRAEVLAHVFGCIASVRTCRAGDLLRHSPYLPTF